MSFSATLGGTALTILTDPEPGFANLVRDLVVAMGARGDLPRYVGPNPPTSRTIPLRVNLTAADGSKDGAIAAVSAINIILSGPTQLVVQPGGASNSITFNVFGGSAALIANGALFEGASVALCDLALVCEPYAYGPLTTLYTAQALTTPGYLDLTAMVGEYPAPLMITLQSTTTELHSCYVGLLAAAAWSGFLVEAESLTWTGGTAAAGSTTHAHGPASRKNTNTVAAIAPIDVTAFPAGAYMVLVRAMMENAADSGTITIGRDAAIAEQYGSTVTVPGVTTWAFYEAGVVVLPNRTVRASATSSLYVSMASSSAVAGHAVELDYVCFVPLSLGNLIWHHAVAASHCNRLYLDGTGALYVEDAVNPQYATGSSPLKARTGRLVIAAEDPSGATAGQTMNVTVAYYPRYSLWR